MIKTNIDINASGLSNNSVPFSNSVIDAYDISRRSAASYNVEIRETIIYSRVLEIAREGFFLSLKRTERTKELESLKVTEKDSITKEIGRHFEDRMVASESAFQYYGCKPSGLSSGCIVRKHSDDYLFLVKDTVPLTKPTAGQKVLGNLGFYFVNEFSGAVSLINEFVTGPLYKRILYNRAPIIALVESGHPCSMHVRSRFLNHFKTAYEVMGVDTCKYQPTRLKDAQGAEKLFVAMLFVGENDGMNLKNFGVMEVNDEAGKTIKVFAKIDHGESGIRFFSKINEMMGRLVQVCHHYQLGCQFVFAISKFKEAVDEVLKITDKELETLIMARVHELKRMNVDVKGLSFGTWVEPVSFTDVRELEQYYTKKYIVHKKTFTNLNKLLSIIEKVAPTSPEWQNGQWLTAIPWNNLPQWIIHQSKIVASERLEGLNENEIKGLMSVDIQGVV